MFYPHGFQLEPISNEEIKWACRVMGLPSNAFTGQDGTDPRLKAIQSLETCDIEACPGSGKTTLLVAKLAILANRWTSRRQGICVLSHTNAARKEIGDRLSSTSAGPLLLARPHFVGTIHSFINEFLAIPWLRSKGWAIKVIDSDVTLRNRWWSLPRGTRQFLERQHLGPQSLGYTDANFCGGGKEQYQRNSSTHQEMLKACKASTADGYYCFDEMFVWATELLGRCPDVIATLRARFPFVFVDEVQDNNELQSALLHRLFMQGSKPIVRQRFGDSNQGIYYHSGATGSTTDTFPSVPKVDLPHSFRFGQVVADAAAPLGIWPQALVGRGPSNSRIEAEACQNTLFLFEENSVLEVLGAYAKLLVESFDPSALTRGEFTAVIGVHRSDKTDKVPRFMGHYMPDYDPDIAGRQPRPDSLLQYLCRAQTELGNSRDTYPIANYFAEGVLQFLRLSGIDIAASLPKRATRFLLDKVEDAGIRRLYLELVSQLIDLHCRISRELWMMRVTPTAHAIATSIAGQEIRKSEALRFLEWKDSTTSLSEAPSKSREPTNLFHYPANNPIVSIRLASIHSVKGETHTATLVLESFYKTHHLRKLLPWLTGRLPKPGQNNATEDDASKDRLKLHYVAMTRPSHLLCLAMRKDAFTSNQLEQMRKRNWRIIECMPPG